MGSHTQVEKPHSQIMGNAQARKRLKAADFHYLAKFTAFVTNELVEEYYNDLIDKFPDGRLDKESFIKTFHLAFPNRPEDKVKKLADEVANKNDEISMANMMILFFLFCSGKTEDNLAHIFNLFDQDGNKVITIDELLNLMSEMYRKGDADKNEKLELNEFVEGMMSHPVTSKIIGIKTIDALLEMFS